MKETIKWEYWIERKSNDLFEHWKTEFEGNVFGVRTRKVNERRGMIDDHLRIIRYEDYETQTGEGIVSIQMIGIKKSGLVRLMATGQEPMNEPDALYTHVREFIEKYKPIFESHRDLSERFAEYLS